MKKKKKIKIRRQWKIKPLTKVKTSAKFYRRPKAKKDVHYEIDGM